jgi:hypothetical protein
MYNVTPTAPNWNLSNSLKMKLDASGNLGLGVTPSAWGTQNTVLQLLNNTSLISRSGFTALARNLFYTTSDVAAYISNGVATNYLQIDGEHRWLNALSGTAGATMTQNQAMTLSAAGRLLIGKTNDEGFALDVVGTGRFSGALRVNATLFSNNGFNATVLSSSDATNIANGFNLLGSSSYWGIRTSTDFSWNLDVFNSNSPITAFKVANNGAATFSSSVTIGNNLTYGYIYGPSGQIFGSIGANTTWINSGTSGLRFNNAADNVSLMFMSNAGNVGIGMTNPGTLLNTFKSDDLDTVQIRAETDTSSVVSYTGIAPARIEYYRNIATGVDLTIQTKIALGGAGGNIVFAPQGTSTSLTPVERMRITKTGRVGIGTDSPTEATILHLKDTVNGYAGLRFEGNGNYAGTDWTIYASSVAAPSVEDFIGFYNNSATDDATAGYKVAINKFGSLLVGRTQGNVDIAGFRADSDGSAYASIVNGESTYYVRDTTNTTYRFRVSGAGTVFATNTTISSISDIRLKENIRDLDSGIDKIMLLKPRVFDWKEGSGQTGKDVRGFIAQEVEEYFPELVDEWSTKDLGEEETPYKSVRMDIIPVLVKAIQEQQSQIESLKAEIQTLKQ